MIKIIEENDSFVASGTGEDSINTIEEFASAEDKIEFLMGDDCKNAIKVQASASHLAQMRKNAEKEGDREAELMLELALQIVAQIKKEVYEQVMELDKEEMSVQDVLKLARVTHYLTQEGEIPHE